MPGRPADSFNDFSHLNHRKKFHTIKFQEAERAGCSRKRSKLEDEVASLRQAGQCTPAVSECRRGRSRGDNKDQTKLQISRQIHRQEMDLRSSLQIRVRISEVQSDAQVQLHCKTGWDGGKGQNLLQHPLLKCREKPTKFLQALPPT